MKMRSFKLKLVLSYVFVIVVSFGFIALFLDKNLEENSLQNIRSSLITQARLIEAQIPASSVRQGDVPTLENLVKTLSLRTQCRITIIDNTGKVLADSEKTQKEVFSMENHLYRSEVKAALGGLAGSDIRYSPSLKIPMLYVALPLQEGDIVSGVLRLALPLESVKHTLFAIRKTILFGLIFALALALAFGVLVAQKTVNPVNRMIQASRRFSEGDFSRRIFPSSKDEIGELAETLNRMAQMIENKINEVKTQNQKLTAIFNSMIEGTIVIDKAGRIVSVNSAVEDILGVTKADVEGRTFLEAIRQHDIAEVMETVLKEGRPLVTEVTLFYPLRRIFKMNAGPIFDQEGVAGCLMVIHDITELRRLETVRSDFVANVSHELKTPLTSIKGFVETLLEGAIDDKDNNRNFLKIIQDQTERLNHLVDDLLSLSHLESKQILLKKEDVDLRQQVEEVLLGFRSQLNRKAIDVKNELPAHFMVKADRDKMTHVLINLIDNAIKFNKEQGSIRIASLKQDGKIKVYVEDSGLGIPAKDIPRIFERFYRVDKARSRELGGTGLGLSIVKHIVELHDGSVGVESTEGLGSKFWFVLPC